VCLQVEHRHFEGQDFMGAAAPFLPHLKQEELTPVLVKMAQKVVVCGCVCDVAGCNDP